MEKSPKIIAVDVVLLPQTSQVDLITLARSQANSNSWFLDDEYLPHISLSMGAVKYDQLLDILMKLGQILDSDSFKSEDGIEIETTSVSNLKRIDSSHSQDNSNDFIIGLNVKKTEIIQKLHQEIHQAMKHFYQKIEEPLESWFWTGGERSKQAFNLETFFYFKKFDKSSCFENYDPHITLGLSDRELKSNEFLDVRERIYSIHLFQLGTFCSTPRSGLIEEVKPVWK